MKCTMHIKPLYRLIITERYIEPLEKQKILENNSFDFSYDSRGAFVEL